MLDKKDKKEVSDIDILDLLEEYLTRHPYQEDGTELTEAIVRIVVAIGYIKKLKAEIDDLKYPKNPKLRKLLKSIDKHADKGNEV